MFEDATGWILLVAIILLLFFLLTRTRKKQRSNKLDTAIAVLGDINHNLKVMELRKTDKLSKKNFKVDNWKFNKEQLVFIEKEMVELMDQGFKVAEEFKVKIDTAKKSKTLESLPDMDYEQMKEPFLKGRQALLTWLRANVNSELGLDKRRSWLGF